MSTAVTSGASDIRLVSRRRRARAEHAGRSAPFRDASLRGRALRGTQSGSQPSVWHVSRLPADFSGREAIAPILQAVARELDPFVATFFTLDDDRELESTVAHGSRLPPAPLVERVRVWESRLHGLDPLAPAAIAETARPIVGLADVGGAQRAVLDKGWVRGTYQEIGVINDLRLLIRDGGRLVAGVTLWRRLPTPAWSDEQRRRLAVLQPLVELAYLSCLRTGSSLDARLPETLTVRQRQVARLLASGATNPEIACALQIGSETVKSHTEAVFAKLGVKSRRELMQRLSRPDGAPTLLGGDEAARQLIGPVLGWSAEHIDAMAGGCYLFSARREPVGEAWGVAPGRRELDLDTVRLVHKEVVARQPSVLIGRLDAAPGRPPVLQAEGIGEVTARHGMTTPLLAVLRRRGVIAGVVWLCRDADASRDQRDASRDLRAMHPLLELAQGSAATELRGHASTEEELSERGLSARELAVARLALAGESNPDIARRLGISQSTVKKHMSRVLAKCGVSSRNQLIALLGDGTLGG